jgi:hypothetical protein
VPATPIVGRVVDKHLSDELGENLALVIDCNQPMIDQFIKP